MNGVVLGLGVGGLYLIGALAGLSLTSLAESKAVIWLPNAILLAALLHTRFRLWPGLLLAAFVAHVVAGIAVFGGVQAIMLAVIHCLECLMLASLLRRILRLHDEDPDWGNSRTMVAFLFLVLLFAAPLAGLLSAAVSSDTNVSSSDYLDQAQLWWFGDAAGLLVLTPLISGLLARTRAPMTMEFWLIAFVTGIIWALLFLPYAMPIQELRLVPMILCVPLIWAAMRTGFYLTTLLAAVFGVLTLILNALGHGVFVSKEPLLTSLMTQEYLLILLTITYLVASYASELKRKSKQLRIYKNILDSVHEGVVVTRAGQDEPIIYCNQAFEEMSGYPPEEIIGRNCRFLNERHREQPALVKVRDAIKAGNGIETVLLNSRKSGEEFWNNLSISPIRNKIGEVEYFAGIQADVTDKVNQSNELERLVDLRTRELEAAKERVLLATDVSGLGIWEWDLKTDELVWDARMHEIYETGDRKGQQLLYELWRDSVHPEDVASAEEALANAVRDKVKWHYEFRLQMPDARVKYIRAAASVCLNENGEAYKVIGGNLDVTEHKQQERELRELVQVAETATKAKTEFLANMSHEIRTPMNGVIGMAELLATTSLNAQQNDYLGMIRNSARSLLSLLNDILDLSKIESGQLTLDPSTFDLGELIGDIVKSFAITAHSKNLELHHYIAPDVPAWIEADATRLGQILFNLIGNAVKFTDEGEVNIRVTRSNKVGDGALGLEIKVEDTGIGIEKEKQEAIFNPFQQADGSITRKFGGTGLGLTIVLHLVDLMQGDFILESEAGTGTTCTLQLPVLAASAPEGLEGSDSDRQQILREKLRHCLVVDDNMTNLRWLQDMIKGWGGRTESATSALQALALVEEAAKRGQPIEIMLIDKNMPQASGFDLVKMIRQMELPMPEAVVMLSSSRADQDIDEARELGIGHYLLKPVKQSEVLNTLINLFVSLPEKEASALTMKGPQAEIPLKILLAEDNVINQRLVTDILEMRGHEVVIAENGRVALDLFRNCPFDLVLMDVQMPQMDGLEATRLIRQYEAEQNRSAVRIVALTAHALTGDRETCLDAGMDDYLTKPVIADHLIQLVESGQVMDAKGSWPSESLAAAARDADRPAAEPPQPSRKWFDYEHSLLVTGNKIELLRSLAAKTIELAPALQAEIDELLADNRIEEAATQVHKLKGMVANLCHQDLVHALKQFEQTLLEQREACDPAKWQSLQNRLDSFYKELTKFLGE